MAKTRRYPLILSLISLVGAILSAVYYKRQAELPPYVNHGDSLMVVDNHTGDSVEYVPASSKN